MRIYLVQHGEAKPKEEDPERSLTARGEADVRRVAEFAERAGIQVGQIRHSGKLRAEQTADILAHALRPKHGIVSMSGLNPNDDVEPVAQAADLASEPVMFVGHLPHLARLAARLVTGHPDRDAALFRMGGIVCLERIAEGRWVVAWMVTPDLLQR
jgi:phosphohistidine phosphatase